MPEALVATVGKDAPGTPRRPSVHRILRVDGSSAEMPRPVVVVLVLHPDGPMAYRYADDGSFGGDTWHESREAAMRALTNEYGELLSGWQQVPDGSDPITFALRLVH